MAHRDAAAVARTTAEKTTDPSAKGEAEASANRHEAAASAHEKAAEGHASDAKSAPEAKGVGAWVAGKLKGLGERMDKAKEGIEKGGEAAQKVEDQALHGDPLKGMTDVIGAGVRGHIVPGLGAAKLLPGGEAHEGHGEE